MSDPKIDSLKEALKYSPDNVPLRLLLADSLLAAHRLEEAELEYAALLRTDNNPNARIGLARVFFEKNNYSASIVIMEEIFEKQGESLEMLVLYTRALVREKDFRKAQETYQRVISLSPGYIDEELDGHFRVRGHQEIEEEETDPAHFSLEKPDIDFDDVGGMESVKREIELKIIKPLQHPDLYKAYGKKVGGGILLYGPPGCGKTFIAKATAGQIKARFFNISLNDILDMWIGNSEKNLHEVFEFARQHTPCVVFIDEMDALGANRNDMKQSAGRQLINQFLLELDGIAHDNEGILILGATNTPWHLDPAFRRPGRFDRIIFVPPPDEKSRESILRLKLKNKPATSIDYERIAQKTEKYSGADIDALIDRAIETKLEESFRDGIPRPIDTKDLLSAAKLHKPSTQEWFATAKNYALFANDAGLYDDVLTYLKLK